MSAASGQPAQQKVTAASFVFAAPSAQQIQATLAKPVTPGAPADALSGSRSPAAPRAEPTSATAQTLNPSSSAVMSASTSNTQLSATASSQPVSSSKVSPSAVAAPYNSAVSQPLQPKASVKPIPAPSATDATTSSHWDARIVAHKVSDGYEFVLPAAPAPRSVLSGTPFHHPHFGTIFCEATADKNAYGEGDDKSKNPNTFRLANGEYRFKLSQKSLAAFESVYSSCIRDVAQQLIKFLTEKYSTSAARAKLIVAHECTINLLGSYPGSPLAIVLPADSPSLKAFEPIIKGDVAKCIKEGTSAPPHYQTIFIAPVMSSSAPQMLVKQLCNALQGQQASLRELWRWNVVDVNNETIAQTGEYQAIVDLRDKGSGDSVISEADACRIMNALPGWLDLGYTTVKLYYVNRYAYCSVCKLEPIDRHTNKECPRKTSTQAADTNAGCDASEGSNDMADDDDDDDDDANGSDNGDHDDAQGDQV